MKVQNLNINRTVANFAIVAIEGNAMDENIVGKKYNHWTVVALVESSGRDKKIECVCDCGTRRIVSKKNIVSGKSSSCGCSRKQVSHASRIKNADTKGELLVENALIAMGASWLKNDNKEKSVMSSSEGKFFYKKQERFDVDDTYFVFDFLVFAEKMIAIEYDGGLHFKLVHIGGDEISEFFQQHERDIRKDEFCEALEIPLLRIRYDQDEQIEELVKDVLSNPDKYIKNHNYEGSKYYDEWKLNFEQLMKGR